MAVFEVVLCVLVGEDVLTSREARGLVGEGRGDVVDIVCFVWKGVMDWV